MALTITPSGGAATTFSDPFDSFKDTVGAYYINPGEAQDPQYALEEPNAPATDGGPIKRHGFRGLDIESMEVIYISTTAAGCIAAYRADVANIKNKNCSVAIPGDQTYPSCEVEKFKQRGRPKDMSNGKYRLHCDLEINQKRTV